MVPTSIDALTFAELSDRLEDLEGRRTPVGWTPEDASLRASIERCILARVLSEGAGPDAGVACELEIRLCDRDRDARGVVRSIGPGGIWVDTRDPWPAGVSLDLEVHHNTSEEHGLKVRGRIATAGRGRVRVVFDRTESESQERRVRRLVLDALRHRV